MRDVDVQIVSAFDLNFPLRFANGMASLNGRRAPGDGRTDGRTEKQSSFACACFSAFSGAEEAEAEAEADLPSVLPTLT